MKAKTLAYLLVFFILGINSLIAHASDNQTDDLSPILSGSKLPFKVTIEKANFELPVGLHSGVAGVYKGLWVFIAGRMNGLHGFGGDPFPADLQNTDIYVVNPATGVVLSRSLKDPSSGLTQEQIDTLSVTSPQGYQKDDTIYMTGGYGIETSTGLFTTKPVLTAINLQGIVSWVTQPMSGQSVAGNIRQLYNPIFQITGGKMYRLGSITQLIFGQTMNGVYNPSGNGIYSEQIRRFIIKEANGQLAVDIYPSKPQIPDPNFRRRDLSVIPALLNNNGKLEYGYVAYSGVFTLATGVWTVPVVINEMGDPKMADPHLPSTFKQGMNNYDCANISLYSRQYESMFNIFFGGISYGYYANGVFTTDNEIPFINQVTTVKMDKNGLFTQYLMPNQYPVILSTQANPGNTLLFGAEAYFMINNIQQYPNNVINLDNIRRPAVIGYIVGGIQSTLPNTNTEFDSAGSPYVFKVTLSPNK